MFKIIKNILTKIFYTPCLWCAKFIWQSIILNIYRFYLSIKKLLKNIFSKHNNKLAIFLNNKLIVPLILIFLTLTVLTNNIAAKESTREDFGRNSLLFTMVEDEFSGHEIIKDDKPVQINNTSYRQNIAEIENTKTIEPDLTQNLANEELTVTQGGSALVKQSLISPEQARTRTEIEEYTVESGDTASSIAKKFGLSVNTMLWSNNLKTYSIIKPGQTLKILPENGLLHKIIKGDTLKKIANKYQADEINIIESNKNINPTALAVGSILFVPNGVPPAPKIIPRSKSSISIKNIFTPPSTNPNTGTKLLWPANSHRINQYYSWHHHGLDINGRIGDPAYAPESGKVIRAGWNRSGYGNNVMIDHGNGIVTLQAHFSKLLVKKGDTVKRGDVIALIGSTGHSTGPHIHFEVRINGKRVNPLGYIK